jgi:peptidyl-prolyl cis-trans isomerase A (cyclophilin A)
MAICEDCFPGLLFTGVIVNVRTTLGAITLERTTVSKYHHAPGMVSMARGAGADTATSDFFILLNDQPSLDFGGMRFDDGQGAAAFGYISSESMETVRKIQAQPTEGQALTPPITILIAKRVNP